MRPAVATDYLDSRRPVYRVYYPTSQGLAQSLSKMVADFGLACGFEDLPRDTRRLAQAAVKALGQKIERASGHRLASDCQLHVLGSLFFGPKAHSSLDGLSIKARSIPLRCRWCAMWQDKWFWMPY